MLADTDAGSLILSAQSGATWGYRLLLLQIILVPVLFMAQELTLRLGLATGKGHGELIKEYFGSWSAWISVVTLVICCIGALLTELSGLVAVGDLFGIAPGKTLVTVVSLLTLMIWTGSYRSIERIAICVGIFEIIFVLLAWLAHPGGTGWVYEMVDIPLGNTSYLYLVAGNIGAVLMPWMIFFQQSAVVDKGLKINHLRAARWDTAMGAVLTQVIMASVLVLATVTLGQVNPNMPLQNITEFSNAVIPKLGSFYGLTLFALAMAGAAIVATIVVSLTAAWGIGEMMGFRHSLSDHPKSAPWFYGSYIFILILCALLIYSNAKYLVALSVAIQVMNAILLPMVLMFLFLLAKRALPPQYALKGWYSIFVGTVLCITSGFGLLAGCVGTFMSW
ncbi:MAG: divalent metal cation transporter [Gammaproteobacteria bacterium]|nr:divalent metal cation transporter [Gammaproteobacteria bacterium]